MFMPKSVHIPRLCRVIFVLRLVKHLDVAIYLLLYFERSVFFTMWLLESCIVLLLLFLVNYSIPKSCLLLKVYLPINLS